MGRGTQGSHYLIRSLAGLRNYIQQSDRDKELPIEIRQEAGNPGALQLAGGAYGSAPGGSQDKRGSGSQRSQRVLRAPTVVSAGTSQNRAYISYSRFFMDGIQPMEQDDTVNETIVPRGGGEDDSSDGD